MARSRTTFPKTRRAPATRGAFVLLALLVAAGIAPVAAQPAPAPAGESRWLLDSSPPVPHGAWGMNAEVVKGGTGLQTFDAYDPEAVPAGSPARAWIEEAVAAARRDATAIKARNERAILSTDIFVLPKSLIDRHRDAICDDQGRLDIHRPAMQDLFRALLRETLARIPEIDGLLVRTGEVYLHRHPHHAASATPGEGRRLGNSAILRGPSSHIEILRILREEICERGDKFLLYRTWSFGRSNFHESPAYYLEVTDAIPPHPRLFFSIKHQQGDFHQNTPFNPTLTIGKHSQLVEVQSQREAYGKGAHPYYIGSGVIDGWEEYAWMMKPGQPRGLKDIVGHPLFAGVWIWSRGGGWEGPVVANHFWNELNTYVVARFVADPTQPEEAIFDRYARGVLGLSDADARAFRELCLLSTRAVLRGQLTTLGPDVDVWWARDHFMEKPDLSAFIKRGLVDEALAEKAEAVALWKKIESLADGITFPNADDDTFVRVSATYGRIKYGIIEQAWRMVFADATGDREALRQALASYDALWDEWRALEKSEPLCPTIGKDTGFEGKPGIGAAANHFREILAGSPAPPANP